MQDGHTRGWHTGHALLTKRWLVRYIISVAAALSKTRNFLGLTVKTDFQLTPRQKRGHQRPRTFFTVSVHSTVEAKNNRKIVRNKFKPQRLNRAGTFVWILLITWISFGTTIRKVSKTLLLAFWKHFLNVLNPTFLGRKIIFHVPSILFCNIGTKFLTLMHPASLIFTFFHIFQPTLLGHWYCKGI